MNVAQLFIALIGLGAAVVTFYLMRFPHTCHDPFRQYGGFSFSASLAGAVIIFLVCTLSGKQLVGSDHYGVINLPYALLNSGKQPRVFI